MADEGIEHCGQGELERCEVTHTSSSSGVSLIEVISSPSGKGNSGVVGIACHLLQHRFVEAYQTAQSFSMVRIPSGKMLLSWYTSIK